MFDSDQATAQLVSYIEGHNKYIELLQYEIIVRDITDNSVEVQAVKVPFELVPESGEYFEMIDIPRRLCPLLEEAVKSCLKVNEVVIKGLWN